MSVTAFTISSNNYLGMARVFAESFLRFHPDATVYTCLVDRVADDLHYEEMPFEIIPVEDLAIPAFPVFSFKYDILELNTAVKPFVFKYLRDKIGLDRAFYFDPDILVHDRLSDLEHELDRNLAVLTPHLTHPIDNTCRPPERVIGMCGVYNLGFLGLRLEEKTTDFLEWWCERLSRYCFVDLANGMFVDQSWMDFAPSYLETTAIVRDPIYNIAYWNLPHRHPQQVGDEWRVEGRRVGFFHFSGVDLDNTNEISRHQDRINLGLRPELRPLFEEYEDLVRNSGQDAVQEIPYSFAKFTGTEITVPAVARRALHEVDPGGVRWRDPFRVDSSDSFLGWLAEAVYFDNERTNRAAMYLWECQSRLQSVFPRIPGSDLPDYMKWFLDGGAEEFGLDDVFVEALLDPDRVSAVIDWKRISAVGLSDPGTDTHWLNEPVDSRSDPILTRLAIAIYSSRHDVQIRFPDPEGADRAEYAYWFVRFGAMDYGLHPSLIEPVARGLAARSRLSIRLKNSTSKPGGRSLVPPPRQPSKPIQIDENRALATSAEVGVNLVGFFEGVEGTGGFAAGIRGALEQAGIPYVAVPLDHDLPDLMTTSRIRYESGAPFPVTVLALPSNRWESAIENLPTGARVGGRIVGYCCDTVEAIRATELTGVDEAWVPTDREAHRILAVAPVPVRPVLSPFFGPRSRPAESRFKLDQGRTWFLVMDYGRGEADDLAISRALECVRRQNENGTAGIGLLLLVHPNRLGLKTELRHLPVSVFGGQVTPDVAFEALDACDGLLDLSRYPRLAPVTTYAASSGKPVLSNHWQEVSAEAPADIGPSHVTIHGPESPELILNAIEGMCSVADRDSAIGPVADELTIQFRTEWQNEAVDQWKREIIRVFESVG